MDGMDELRSPSLPTSLAASIIVFPSPSTLSSSSFSGQYGVQRNRGQLSDNPEEACMGRLKSSIEFRRSAPPSSSTWPVLRDMLSTDDLREARQQARIIALHPCIRRIQRIQTMMQ
jgi:hypothetical protein